MHSYLQSSWQVQPAAGETNWWEGAAGTAPETPPVCPSLDHQAAPSDHDRRWGAGGGGSPRLAGGPPLCRAPQPSPSGSQYHGPAPLSTSQYSPVPPLNDPVTPKMAQQRPAPPPAKSSGAQHGSVSHQNGPVTPSTAQHRPVTRYTAQHLPAWPQNTPTATSTAQCPPVQPECPPEQPNHVLMPSSTAQ